jgi:hypothetical protein
MAFKSEGGCGMMEKESGLAGMTTEEEGGGGSGGNYWHVRWKRTLCTGPTGRDTGSLATGPGPMKNSKFELF